MNNIDQHMDDYLSDKAAKEAAEKAKQAELDAFDNMHYVANCENSNRDRIKWSNLYLAKVVRELRGMTELEVYHNEAEGRILIGNWDTSPYLAVEFECIGKWRSVKTKRVRIVVGYYGTRQPYPQKKDGGHNYNKIALALMGHHNKHVRETLAHNQSDANRKLVNELAAELGMASFQSKLRPTDSAERPVNFQFSIDSNMTVEGVKNLITKLRSIGFEIKS